ncbi:MAG: hypothetical protein JOZ41_11365 [Chloroflexi bacterium]|nr:hypothetical protein [Chloroflexota bacterium]
MHGYRRAGWEDQLPGEFSFLVIVLLVLVIAALWTILVATGKELARIYERSGSYSRTTLRIIGYSLAGFVTVVVLCWLVSLVVPSAAAAPVYAAAWGFLAVVLVVEGCDWYERRHGAPESALGDLDTYLDFTPVDNAHLGSEVKNGKAEPAAIG